MKTIKKVLIPTDFSAFSLAALDYVKAQPELDEATVFIIHVVNDPVLVAPYPNVDLNAETVLRDSSTRAEDELHRFILKNFAETRLVVGVVRRGDAAREITKFADEEHCDLVVIATHGRTGLAHMLMGSVAEKVVRGAHVPVLSVKPEEVVDLMKEHEVPAEVHVGVR